MSGQPAQDGEFRGHGGKDLQRVFPPGSGFFVVNLVQHARCTVAAGRWIVPGQFFDSIVVICPSGQDVLGESWASAMVARASPAQMTVASAAYRTRARLMDGCMVILP
jgi:hypothetical protein